MNPAAWREALCLNKVHIAEEWAVIALDLSIGAPDSGPIVFTLKDAETWAARDSRGIAKLMAALSAAAQQGWLAPLEWTPDGSIRTALTVPEGV